MIFPTFQYVQFVNKEGYLTSAMQMYNDELNNVLRNGLSDNGWTVPNITNAQLTELEGLPLIDRMPLGTLWYITDAVPPTLVVKMDDGAGNAGLYKISTTTYP